MLAADFLLFSISFLGSLVGVFVYNFSTADHDNIHVTFGMLGLSLFIAVVAIVSLALSIVAFVKSRKSHAGAEFYIAWPYIGFAILIPMAVLSIVAAVKMSKQQADVY